MCGIWAQEQGQGQGQHRRGGDGQGAREGAGRRGTFGERLDLIEAQLLLVLPLAQLPVIIPLLVLLVAEAEGAAPRQRVGVLVVIAALL